MFQARLAVVVALLAAAASLSPSYGQCVGSHPAGMSDSMSNGWIVLQVSIGRWREESETGEEGLVGPVAGRVGLQPTDRKLFHPNGF